MCSIESYWDCLASDLKSIFRDEKRIVVPLVLGGGERSLLSIAPYEFVYLTSTPSFSEFEAAKRAYDILYRESLQFGSGWIEGFLSNKATLDGFCRANELPHLSVLMAGIFARAKINGWVFSDFNFGDLYCYEVDN